MKLNQTSSQFLKTSISFFENILEKRNKNKTVFFRNKSNDESRNFSQLNNYKNKNLVLKNISFYLTKSKYLNLFNIKKNLSFKNYYSRNKLTENEKKEINLKKIKNYNKKQVYENFDERQQIRQSNIKSSDYKRKLRLKIFNLLRKNSISFCKKFENKNMKYNKKIISYLKGPIYFKKAVNSNSEFKYNYLDRENNLISTIYNPEIKDKKIPQEILKEGLNNEELKLLWQNPNYYLYLNPFLKYAIIKDNKSLLNNFQFEEKLEKITNINSQKNLTLKGIMELKNIDNNKNIIEKTIENVKEKVKNKIMKLQLYKRNKNKFKIGQRNIPDNLKKEIDNKLRKSLQLSYSSSHIHFSKFSDEKIPIENNLKEISLIKNKKNIDKGIEIHYKMLEKIKKEKSINNKIKSLKNKFIKIYK